VDSGVTCVMVLLVKSRGITASLLQKDGTVILLLKIQEDSTLWLIRNVDLCWNAAWFTSLMPNLLA
jgi:hypothetical protein